MIDESAWRVGDTADYICSRRFSVVTLQFPDEQLQYAARVANAVQTACAARKHAVQVYILADTTYNSLSVDEVAAAHANAQCVVHYGRASMTKLSRLPAFFVFPEQEFNLPAAAACLAGSSLLADSSSSGGSKGAASSVLVFVDQPLLHQLEQLKAALLQLLEQQQGPNVGKCLVFPTVPSQQMEPAQPLAGQQQQQQHTCRRPVAPGCCGGGSHGSQQQREEQQQEAGCSENSAGACPCVATASTAEACSEPEVAAEGGPVSSSDASSSNADNGGSCSGGDGGTSNASSGDSSSSFSLAGYQWQLSPREQPHECGMMWVGAPDAPALLHLQLTYSTCRWAMLDPTRLPPSAPGNMGAAPGSVLSADAAAASAAAAATAGAAAGALSEGLPLDISRTLRRRYFLVEKARDAAIVGILVGTLGAAGYGEAVGALRAAAAAAGKKTYTLLMGKPSPAKLANFPEIEVFVLVADPQGQILDSKEYLAPIITPHEAMLAFSPPGGASGEWDERRYRLDFDGVLHQAGAAAAAASSSQRQEPRFSLLSGGYVGGDSDSTSDGGDESEPDAPAVGSGDAALALALHAQQALQVTAAPGGRSDLVQARSAADYFLHKRSWQGVEAPLVGAAPKPVEAAAEGRSGRAAGYADEPGWQGQPTASAQ